MTKREYKLQRRSRIAIALGTASNMLGVDLRTITLDPELYNGHKVGLSCAVLAQLRDKDRTFYRRTIVRGSRNPGAARWRVVEAEWYRCAGVNKEYPTHIRWWLGMPDYLKKGQ